MYKKKIKDAAKILERISFLPFPIDVKKKNGVLNVVAAALDFSRFLH